MSPKALESNKKPSRLCNQAIQKDLLLGSGGRYFGAGTFNDPTKTQLRKAYYLTEPYLDVFEEGWSDHEVKLITTKDWDDWLSYLNNVAVNPLFRCAAYRADQGKSYSTNYLDLIRGRSGKNDSLQDALKEFCPER